jgi:hypothetical protein
MRCLGQSLLLDEHGHAAAASGSRG